MMTELTEHPTVRESYFSLGQEEDTEGLLGMGLGFGLEGGFFACFYVWVWIFW